MAGKTFWYKLMDLMHYGQMHLTSPARGFMVFAKRDWATAFYDGEESPRSDRAWERFKVAARAEGLPCQVPGAEDEEGESHAPCTRGVAINMQLAFEVGPTLDALYIALGPPHPAGLKAQVRCERERRERLLPLVVRGIAAAARVEQRRLVG